MKKSNIIYIGRNTHNYYLPDQVNYENEIGFLIKKGHDLKQIYSIISDLLSKDFDKKFVYRFLKKIYNCQYNNDDYIVSVFNKNNFEILLFLLDLEEFEMFYNVLKNKVNELKNDNDFIPKISFFIIVLIQNIDSNNVENIRNIIKLIIFYGGIITFEDIFYMIKKYNTIIMSLKQGQEKYYYDLLDLFFQNCKYDEYDELKMFLMLEKTLSSRLIEYVCNKINNKLIFEKNDFDILKSIVVHSIVFGGIDEITVFSQSTAIIKEKIIWLYSVLDDIFAIIKNNLDYEIDIDILDYDDVINQLIQLGGYKENLTIEQKTFALDGVKQIVIQINDEIAFEKSKEESKKYDQEIIKEKTNKSVNLIDKLVGNNIELLSILNLLVYCIGIEKNDINLYNFMKYIKENRNKILDYLIQDLMGVDDRKRISVLAILGQTYLVAYYAQYMTKFGVDLSLPDNDDAYIIEQIIDELSDDLFEKQFECIKILMSYGIKIGLNELEHYVINVIHLNLSIDNQIILLKYFIDIYDGDKNDFIDFYISSLYIGLYHFCDVFKPHIEYFDLENDDGISIFQYGVILSLKNNNPKIFFQYSVKGKEIYEEKNLKILNEYINCLLYYRFIGKIQFDDTTLDKIIDFIERKSKFEFNLTNYKVKNIDVFKSISLIIN